MFAMCVRGGRVVLAVLCRFQVKECRLDGMWQSWASVHMCVFREFEFRLTLKYRQRGAREVPETDDRDVNEPLTE